MEQQLANRPRQHASKALSEVVGALAVKIPAKSLKLGAEQYRVSVIDLLSGVSAATADTAHALVRSLQFIERNAAVISRLEVISMA